MIKNDIYTYDYYQPEEYKFSLDSVFLAQKVAGLINGRDDLKNIRVLDLCAGCGIIGLELSLHVKDIQNIDFLEVQELYRPYFDKNVKMIYPEEKKNLHFLNLNYSELLTKDNQNTYDLIVCNPPYFFKGEGLLSPNEFKNRCRFFLDSDFQTLIASVVHSLKEGASAFLLIRSGNHHGRDPLTDIKKMKSFSSAEIVDDVRGTHIVEIRK